MIRALRDRIEQYYDLVMKLADVGELVVSELVKYYKNATNVRFARST